MRETKARVTLWGLRALGVVASVYILFLAALNLPNAWNENDRTGGHYTSWPAIIYLSVGVIVAASVFYWVLGGSTVRATFARLVAGAFALVLWVFSAAVLFPAYP